MSLNVSSKLKTHQSKAKLPANFSSIEDTWFTSNIASNFLRVYIFLNYTDGKKQFAKLIRELSNGFTNQLALMNQLIDGTASFNGSNKKVVFTGSAAKRDLESPL